MVSSVRRSSHPSQRFPPSDNFISKASCSARLTKNPKHIEYVRRLVKELKQTECMRRLNKNPKHTRHLNKKQMEYLRRLSEKLKHRDLMHRLAHFFVKRDNSTEQAKGCHLDATSEFSFIPIYRPQSVVSAPPVLGITPDIQRRSIMRTRRVRPQRDSSRSVIAFLNCLKTGLIFIWSVFTLFIVVYTGARCYEQGSFESFINSLEGAFMLGFLIAALISAVIMYILFKKYGREIRGELHPDDGFELSSYV